jgi:hypothetical protein
MKFTAFHLMSYPYLPPDFTQKHHSVWVDIPRSLYDPKLGHQIYNDYLDQLEFADRLSFDGIGVNEHHQNAWEDQWSPHPLIENERAVPAPLSFDSGAGVSPGMDRGRDTRVHQAAARGIPDSELAEHGEKPAK